MAQKKQEGEKKKNNDAKVAFVISPIGEPDSPIRKRADQIMKHVIEPVTSKSGYEIIRADKISKPGIITSQIIEHIINDALVIADLTGHNPNVFYELAVRHTLRKPVIQLIEEGQLIPFDVSTTRTIYINHQDLDSVDKAKRELEEQTKAVEKDPTSVDSPISMAFDLQRFKQSRTPESKAIAELRAYLQEVSFMTRELYRARVESQELASQAFQKVSKEKQDLEKKLVHLHEEMARHPRIIIYRRAIKKIQILNMRGDASVSYDFECVNGGNLLRKMEHVILYDGNPLKPSDVVIKTRGESVPPKIETLDRCEWKDNKYKIVKRETTLSIIFEPPVKPQNAFTYSYGFRYKKVYQNLRQREYTAHRVMHETDMLEIHVLAPPNHRFSNDCDITIVDFNTVRDEEEGKILSTRNPPRLISNDREILWEIPLPKITYTYTLFFKVVKEK